jgi:hypothetical protein
MKKEFVVTTLLLLALSLSPVSARPSTPSSILKNQEPVQNRIETRQNNFEIIKDTRKQKIVENLEKSYVNINKRWTTHFSNVLERLTKIADKINAPAELKNKIATTKIAINTQAAKTYTITFTDETKLGESAKTVHDQLRTDLESLRDQIQSIRESLRKIIVTKPAST